MSLILLFFYGVMIPVFLLSVMWWLLGMAKTKLLKGLVIVITLAVFSGLLWIAVGEKWMLDRQVRALCAKDGGIRVYETVPLPPELVDKYGVIRIPSKKNVKASDEYYYERELQYIQKGNPEVWKSNHRIIRSRDHKILGESTRYVRRGGGLPGPWHSSSFGCPFVDVNQPQLEASIFIKD